MNKKVRIKKISKKQNYEKVKIKVSVEGIGFISLLQLIFITLKLIGKINWSWLWVLSPLWIPISLIICVLLILIVCEIIL